MFCADSIEWIRLASMEGLKPESLEFRPSATLPRCTHVAVSSARSSVGASSSFEGLNLLRRCLPRDVPSPKASIFRSHGPAFHRERHPIGSFEDSYARRPHAA